MSSQPKNRQLNIAVFYSLFAILVAAYMQFIFKPGFYYFKNQSLFLPGLTYFKFFLSHAGGVCDYVAAFLLQFDSIPVAGVLMHTGLLVVVFVLYRSIFKQISMSVSSLLIILIPFGFFVVFQNQYSVSLSLHLRLIIVLASLSLYLKLRSDSFRLIILGSSAALYFIVGGLFFLSFLGFILLYETLFIRGKCVLIKTIFCLFIGTLIPYIAMRFIYFNQPLAAWFSNVSDPLLWIALSALPIVLIVLKIVTRIPKLPLAIQQILVLILVPVCLVASFNYRIRQSVYINALAEEGRWPAITHLPIEITHEDMLTHFDELYVNNFNLLRAYAQTDGLLDHLFDQPQFTGSDGLFINEAELGSNITIPTSALYFDLGHIHASKVYCYEALTSFPYHPEVFKRLMLIHFIIGEYKAAEKYLKILQKSWVTRSWAIQYQPWLKSHALCDTDSLVQAKRACIPRKQFFIQIEHPSADLNMLLETNPDNKLAFEYLMAHLLLSQNMNAVVDRLSQFQQLGYHSLPIHIEEALLAHRMSHPLIWQQDPFLQQVVISKRTRNRFRAFGNVVAAYRNNPEKLHRMLSRDFKNTYWYYLTYTAEGPNRIHVKRTKK